jgi:predicted site-specific integrase-resolvase
MADLTLSRAALAMGLSEVTARRMARAGQLPVRVVKGRYLIEQETLERFIHQAVKRFVKEQAPTRAAVPA